MPRLFTALEIPRDAALSLSLLRGGLPGARWIDVENYHMTLRFIGDVEGHVADEIANALDRVRRPAFSLTLSASAPSAPRSRIRSMPAQKPRPTSMRCRARSTASASGSASPPIRASSRRM